MNPSGWAYFSFMKKGLVEPTEGFLRAKPLNKMGRTQIKQNSFIIWGHFQYLARLNINSFFIYYDPTLHNFSFFYGVTLHTFYLLLWPYSPCSLFILFQLFLSTFIPFVNLFLPIIIVLIIPVFINCIFISFLS